MTRLTRQFIYSIALLLFGTMAFAQVYPVQASVVFNTPYSTQISDYATSMDVRMQLLINTTDITINNRQVRLKMFIQGNGINAQSSDFVTGMQPLYINGGELISLTNLDIAPLFKLENLQGISAVQYANPLPEGMYSICFEIYDVLTNQRLSQKSCANIYLMLNDPPLLNLPARNELIAVTDFPNILFTWTPRQVNATNVSYQFELKEIQDPAIDPQIGFLMSPVLYEETLYSTALVYDLSKPNLMPNKRYAWRVRAISTSGLSANAVFKNDGYSEIYHFTYASNCPAPGFLLSEALSTRSVRLSWMGDASHTKYHVQYRKKDVPNAEWFEVYTMNTQTNLSDLEAGVSYEFRVGASCDAAVMGNFSFTYSGINTFSMPTQSSDVTNFSCGLNPSVAISNQTPLTNMVVSETFTAGDFPVKVLELQGHNPYSGKGYIIVPYLADTKIAVIFNNISINTSYQLMNGVVETSYNPQAPNISDVEDLTGGANGTQVTQTVPFPITNITTNPNGDIIVSGANGEQVTIPGGSNVVLTGGDGQVYNIDSNGNPSGPFSPAPGGASTPQNTDGVAQNGQVTQFTAQGISVAFETTPNTKYSWDTVPPNAPSYINAKYAKVGSQYLGYKAIVNQQTDVLKAKINLTDSNIVLDSLVFKTQKGTLIESTKQGGDFILQLKGTQTYAEEEIQAVIRQNGKYKVAGAFRLVHISEKQLNITLVPLNSTSSIPSSAATDLQAIYDKTGVKLTIKTAPVLAYDGDGDGKITTSESGAFDYYTDEEKAISAKIKGLPDYNRQMYYLIYSDLPSDKGVEGFMAIGGQFGYIFPNSTSKTAAHEFSHGAFNLEHPFLNDSDKGKTTFLMDYGSGTGLWHQDWAQINNPQLKFYGFQNDSQGELASGYGLAPNFKFVRTNTSYVSYIKNAAEGFLGGFVYENANEKIYYKWEASQNKYLKNGTPLPYPGEMKNSLPDSEIVYLLFNNQAACGDNKYLRTTYGQIKNKLTLSGIASYINTNKSKVAESSPNVYAANISCSPMLEGDANGSAGGTFNQLTINNKAGIPKDYWQYLTSNYDDLGVPLQINFYKEGQDIPTEKITNGITLNVKVAYEPQYTLWKILEIEPLDLGFTSTANPFIAQCLDEKYAFYLGLLEQSLLYKNKTQPEKLAMKVGLYVYNALFVIRCYFKNTNTTGNCNSDDYVKGVVFELLETIDIVQLVLGGEMLIKQLITHCAENQKELLTTIYTLSKQVVTGTFNQKPSDEQIKTLFSVFLPPCVSINDIEKAGELATVVKNEFTQNPCYNSGRLTVMIVPLVLTAGEYAGIKFASLVPNLIGKGQKVGLKINQLFKKAFKLERNAARYVLRDANGNVVRNYDQFAEFIDDTDNLPISGDVPGSVGNLASHLTGMLKSTYDDFITKGLTAVADGTTIKFLDANGLHIAEIANGKLIYKYAGFGSDIVMTEGKVTTVLGKFAEDFSNPNSNGTRYFLGSADPVVPGLPNGTITRGSGVASPNRLNFLDIPEVNYNTMINNNIKAELDAFLGSPSASGISAQSVKEVRALIKSHHPGITSAQLDDIISMGTSKGNNQFWDTYNLPFLEQAFQRGDDVRLVSDPLIYQADAALGGTYKRELDAITGSSGFSKKYGYTYNSGTKTYTKK